MTLAWRKVIKAGPWILSPRLDSWQKKILKDMQRRVPPEAGLLWLLSSGTQSVDEVKAIAVSVEAMETSAAAVNAHLDARSSDRWLLTLPTYHVGGLSILTRVDLNGAQVFVLKKWRAENFVAQVARDKITLCSLVPTQVFDLVQAGVRCPPSLRAVVVGGGNLEAQVYLSARRLGWPLLPSYGLTECCSQVATAGLNSLERQTFPEMKILKHVQLELREQRVFLRSKSLCRWIARGRRDGLFTLEDPLRDGWLPTEDLGEMHNRGLRILGRRDDVVKVLGILVSVPQVESEAREFFRRQGLIGDLAVVAVPGGREGHDLILVTDSSQSLKEWERQVTAYNAQALGPYRLKRFCWLPSIPRSELHKVKRAALLADLRLC